METDWICLAFDLEEPAAFGGVHGFRDAFLRSIKEFNEYGVAAGNAKYQVGEDLAMQLYAFNAAGPCILQQSTFCVLASRESPFF